MERFPKVLEEIRPDPTWSAETRAQSRWCADKPNWVCAPMSKAKDELTQASAVLPAEARTALARVAAAQGDVSGAMQEAEQIAAAYPSAAVAWVLKGDLLRLKGAEDDAIKSYRRPMLPLPPM
jgi:tetratricopeptide (TPR) repeat protein